MVIAACKGCACCHQEGNGRESDLAHFIVPCLSVKRRLGRMAPPQTSSGEALFPDAALFLEFGGRKRAGRERRSPGLAQKDDVQTRR
jgi:hypothetical protein